MTERVPPSDPSSSSTESSTRSGPASAYRPGLLLHVVPALLYVVAVFVGGSLPDPTPRAVRFDQSDKVFHLIAFAGMQWTQARAIRFLFPESSVVRTQVTAAFTACGIGALLEIWQAALPHRTADPWDLVADCIGAWLMAAFGTWLSKKTLPSSRGTAR